MAKGLVWECDFKQIFLELVLQNVAVISDDSIMIGSWFQMLGAGSYRESMLVNIELSFRKKKSSLWDASAVYHSVLCLIETSFKTVSQCVLPCQVVLCLFEVGLRGGDRWGG